MDMHGLEVCAATFGCIPEVIEVTLLRQCICTGSFGSSDCFGPVSNFRLTETIFLYKCKHDYTSK